MFSMCRLCAMCTEPSELTATVSELQEKLSICCGWKPVKNEIQMPQKACQICVNQLQISWEFVERIGAAEQQLLKIIAEQVQETKVESSLPSPETKTDEDIKQELDEFETEDVKYPPHDNSDDDDVDFYNDDFKDNDAFGEPIDFPDAEDSPSCENLPAEVKKKKLADKNLYLCEPFLAELAVEDCLDGGLISSNGIAKLEKLFPDMKRVSWDDCQYKCDKCSRTFKGPNNFYAHIRSVHIEEVLSIVVPCFYCNTKYRREYALNRHIATEHFVHLKFRCAHCNDYYWNTRELSKHRNMHTDVEYKCEICDQVFTNRDSMYAHCSAHYVKKISNPDEKFICDICTKQFKTKGSIRNHMLLHTDKFEHVCDQCGWRFQTKGNLIGHLASTHATEKPYKCEHCTKCFKTKQNLRNHSIMHDEDFKPHKCTECGAKFRRRNALMVHMRCHTNICPYTCKFCGKSFRHCITLQTHERIHTNDKPYACPNCEYRCTSKGNLNKHMMRAHSIDFRNHKVNLN